MSFVGVVWFYSLGTKFDGDTKAKTNEDIKPFKLFSNSLGDTYKNISASVGQIQKGEDVKRKEEQKQIGLTPVEYVDENGATNPTLIPTTNTNITQ